MRFVPIKNIEQQAFLALHRVRQGFVSARTAQANQIRGLLGEYELIVPQGIAYVAKRVHARIENAALLEATTRIAGSVPGFDLRLLSSRDAPGSSVPGIGPLSATALVASVGHAKNSITAASSLPGSASCRASIQAAASPRCSV